MSFNVPAQKLSNQSSLNVLTGTHLISHGRLANSDNSSFLRTGQEDVLTAKSQDLPAVVNGMRKICAMASTLLGGAVTANGEVTPTTTVIGPTPTSAAITTTHDGILAGSIAMLFLTFTLVIFSGLVV
jgi:hypothetical protein